MAGSADESGAGPAGSLIGQPLPSGSGGASAPILYFDTVPVCGVRADVFSLVLETIIQDVEGDAAANHRRVVAHLRTTGEGLRSLKEAIERIELMAAKPAGGTN